MKKIIFLVVVVISLNMYATTIPYTFTSGTSAKAEEVNANFDYLEKEVKNIQSSHILLISTDTYTTADTYFNGLAYNGVFYDTYYYHIYDLQALFNLENYSYDSVVFKIYQYKQNSNWKTYGWVLISDMDMYVSPNFELYLRCRQDYNNNINYYNKTYRVIATY